MNNNDIEEDIKQLESLKLDRERLEKENTELRKRPVFYYDNNRNTYVWCCRCADSNMSLHMFLENGEIQGYASEHYDKWVKNAKEVKQVDVCEFMHKFVKPLIRKANKYDRLVEKIEKKIEKTERIAKNKDIMPTTIKEERIDGSYVYSQRFNADGYIAEIIVNILKELMKEE